MNNNQMWPSEQTPVIQINHSKKNSSLSIDSAEALRISGFKMKENKRKVAADGFDSLITSVLTPVLRFYSLCAITKNKRCVGVTDCT